MNKTMAWVVTVAVLTSGCGIIKGVLGAGAKAEECKKMATIANEATRKINVGSNMLKGVKPKGMATASFKNIAAACDKAIDDVGKADIKDGDLKPKVESYVGVLKDVKSSINELLAVAEEAGKASETKPAADGDEDKEEESDDGKAEAGADVEKVKAIADKLKTAVDKMNPAIEGINGVCK